MPKDLSTGICNSRIRIVTLGDISVFFSEIDSRSLDANNTNVINHQKVVDIIFKQSQSIIPCRFATFFPDIEDIIIFLKENMKILNEYLSKLEGKAEISIKILFDIKNIDIKSRDNKEVKIQNGMNYLMNKKRKHDNIKKLKDISGDLKQKLDKILIPHSSEVISSVKIIKRMLIRNICYLIEQDQLESFKYSYQQFRNNNPDLRLLYSGPWPPYTFANINLWKGLE
ncbi:hypothetical protein GF312_08860 [Candidatus Poribacteria bacterium]|nr:hypothetical protein [Candidatus Poribacteria bacterium]